MFPIPSTGRIVNYRETRSAIRILRWYRSKQQRAYFLTCLHPRDDSARQVLLPDIGLIIGGEPFAERPRFARMKAKREPSHHHPLVGLGRESRDGERMLVVIARSMSETCTAALKIVALRGDESDSD